ncbi:transposase [Candidatus Erwinia dacicola]|nr:transposase [Candidatus Erwinia dacicola]
MAKHFTPEFKLEAAKLVVDHGYTYVKCQYRSNSDPPCQSKTDPPL